MNRELKNRLLKRLTHLRRVARFSLSIRCPPAYQYQNIYMQPNSLYQEKRMANVYIDTFARSMGGFFCK